MIYFDCQILSILQIPMKHGHVKSISPHTELSWLLNTLILEYLDYCDDEVEIFPWMLLSNLGIFHYFYENNADKK